MIVLLPLAASFLTQTQAKHVDPFIAGPTVVVLLKDGCPCTKECQVALNALADACRGKIKFVGLLDADAKRASALVTEAGLHFPLVPDPKRAAIRAYKGHEALDLRLVGRDGRIAGRWDGLCRANVAALVNAAWTQAGADVSLSLAPFTVTNKLGCEY